MVCKQPPASGAGAYTLQPVVGAKAGPFHVEFAVGNANPGRRSLHGVGSEDDRDVRKRGSQAGARPPFHLGGRVSRSARSHRGREASPKGAYAEGYRAMNTWTSELP